MLVFLYLFSDSNVQNLRSKKEQFTEEKMQPRERVNDMKISEENDLKKDFLEERQRIIQQSIIESNASFQFLGKVIDQNKNPIADVDIRYRVSQPKKPWDSNTIVDSVKSKNDGFFNIQNNGSGFSFISFEKEGYRMAQGQELGFSYTAGTEQRKRVNDQVRTYTLIKKAELPSLIHHNTRLIIEWNGIPVSYNFRTGKLGETGEILITAKRGAVVDGKFDWSFTIEPIDGGVLESNREESFLAPPDGYDPLWERGMKANEPNWSHGSSDEVFLFFKLPDGNYSRVKMYVTAEHGRRISGHIDSYLNPSGGRVLEYDPSKRIK